jgi:hypothetical protein
MSYREKFLHWHFEFTNPSTGDQELVRIPRAFEIGLLFAALPEMAADSWYRNDSDGFEEWWSVFRETAIPPGVSIENVGGVPVPVVETPLIEEVAEQLANRDFFFEMPIVPMSEERKPPEEQFNEYTSRAAIKMGQLFGMSPRRIDHAIEGIYGYVAGDIVDAVGLGPAETDREKELADTPIFGRLFVRGGTEGIRSRFIEDMYEQLAEAQMRQQSDFEPENEEQRQLRLMLTDAAKAVSALLYVRRYTPANEARRELADEASDIAELAVQEYETGNIQRDLFAGYRKYAQGRKGLTDIDLAAQRDTTPRLEGPKIGPPPALAGPDRR